MSDLILEGIRERSKLALKGVHTGRNKALYQNDQLMSLVAKEIIDNHDDNIVQRKVNGMSDKINQAMVTLDNVLENFDSKVTTMNDSVTTIEKMVSTASTKARVSLDKVTGSVLKMGKTGNMASLERYAELLTKLADALERIEALEQTGKLDKVMEAMRT